MSSGKRMPLAEARALASDVVTLLRWGCVRVEVAGSIRREARTVGDIEIVAIPIIEDRPVPGLWGDTTESVNRLDQRLADERDDLPLRVVEMTRADGTVVVGARNGPSYKALSYLGFPVDLFITDAEQWGTIFALRTGPGDWNRRLVQDCQKYFRRVEHGRVLHLGRPVPTPEEADFFRAIGQPWVDPRDRRVERVAIVPPDRLAVTP